MVNLKEFEVECLPKAIAAGGFGEGAELVRVLQDSNEAKDNFASTVLFVDVEMKVQQDLKRFPMVCKFQCASAERREKFNTDFQFFNEVLVYKEIVPLFSKSAKDLLPDFYYGNATLNDSPKDDVVIVENQIPKGFRLTEETVFLNNEHCRLVFKTLGAFHGESLLLKTKRQLKFANAISKLTETRWLKKMEKDNNYFFGENAKRGVMPLIKDGGNVDVLHRFLRRLENVHELMEEIFSVNELSVLCHGDFCRNNMVFRYEGKTPVDMKIFDLATARYASPVVDISFFLFLNTTPELRRDHLQDWLQIYLDALGNIAGVNAFTTEELWQEFQSKAVYGYILASFFLPFMVDHSDSLDNNLKNLTLEERVKLSLKRGGQKVTDILKGSVENLISWGCLD